MLWGTVIFPPMAVMAALVLYTPPLSWLPEADKADTLLGTLLTAQAAIAALTLAVTLFVLQGINARPDADDRMYREYIHRSWVKLIFWGSIYAVGITGLVFLAEEFISGTGAEAGPTPGLRNLLLVAAVAFTANLALAGTLFHRAVSLAHPGQWRALRQDVNERDVRQAIQSFLRRNQRAIASLDANEPDLSTAFPDEGEGSADEAVQSLLDDARSAMAERRQGEFVRSLESVKELLTYALDEMARRQMSWGDPGRQPEWPPLRELGRSLYSFREEIIQSGSREYIYELLGRDAWLAGTGVNRCCGELFTTGLAGYQRTYQVANRMANWEFREVIINELSAGAEILMANDDPEQVFPYALETVRHRERMLSDAMEAGRPEDYQRFHRGSETSLRSLRWLWTSGTPPTAESSNLADRLDQYYRIVLMGLAGRAMDLFQAGRINDPSPYLNMARGVYVDVQQLGGDIAQALDSRGAEGFYRWREWEWEGMEYGEPSFISPERFPLNFFGLRLLELCRDSAPDLDLHGTAQQILNWFENNSSHVEQFVVDDPSATVEQRREYALRALRAAVRRDEVAEEHEIIGRELSGERISNFVSDVYAAAFSQNPVERLFERAGAFLYTRMDDNDAPQERGFLRLEPKGFLAVAPERARVSYAAANGDRWGWGLSEDVVNLLCDALDSAPQFPVPLGTPSGLLGAIDKATEDLGPSEEQVIILAGGWSDFEIRLAGDSPEGYLPRWRIPEDEQVGEVARYRGTPILRGPPGGERRLYVVEPGAWGCFVRAQCQEDRDLRIEINAISAERAREHLAQDPGHFPNEPDEDSKLRKLQTCVELVVVARIGFRVANPSRARRIKGV